MYGMSKVTFFWSRPMLSSLLFSSSHYLCGSKHRSRPTQSMTWTSKLLSRKAQYKHRCALEYGHMKPNTLIDTQDLARQSAKCFVFLKCLFVCFVMQPICSGLNVGVAFIMCDLNTGKVRESIWMLGSLAYCWSTILSSLCRLVRHFPSILYVTCLWIIC